MIDQSGGMTTLMVTHRDTTAIMETALCGAAMAANHAAATMVGTLLDLKLPQIVESLSKLRSVPGRGERMQSLDQADVIVDVAGSPERSAAALRTARSMKGGGRLWCILAIDGAEDSQRLAQYGGLIERFATDGILTSARDTQSSFLKASHAVLDGVQKCAAMRLVADHERAIHWAVREAKPTDTILILGGIGGTTAYEKRSRLQTIARWVAEAREADSDAKEQKATPSLSIFQ
jgi:UDP-N-acetylmuramoyl-L-alanyl-D-glutamate--2,6-diaminopimelate ligase